MNQFLGNVKSDQFFYNQLSQWETQYKQGLNNISLGELGARIEFTIHNEMHMRWCNPVEEFRPNPEPGKQETIDPHWDSPGYQWLGDTYSSHVNPTFWKIHGWCDDRLNDWMEANQYTGAVPWKGTWVGKMPPHPQPESLHSMLSTLVAPIHNPMSAHDHISEMESVVRIILNSGKLCHFYDKVEVPKIKKHDS